MEFVIEPEVDDAQVGHERRELKKGSSPEVRARVVDVEMSDVAGRWGVARDPRDALQGVAHEVCEPQGGRTWEELARLKDVRAGEVARVGAGAAFRANETVNVDIFNQLANGLAMEEYLIQRSQGRAAWGSTEAWRPESGRNAVGAEVLTRRNDPKLGTERDVEKGFLDDEREDLRGKP